MCEHQKTIQEEIFEINNRLERVEKYIRKQAGLEPLLLPRISTTSDENLFRIMFRQQYPGFIPRLRMLIPNITAGEEHLCMMIKLNMNIREISQMMNINVKSVHTSRARFKRKLLLENNISMDEWIKMIDGLIDKNEETTKD